MEDGEAEAGTEAGEVPAPRRGPACALCRAGAPPYRCPACLRRLCSLACSKAHKARWRCSGVRDRTAPVEVARMGDAEMLSDVGFLEDGARVADNAVRLGRAWDAGDGKDAGLVAAVPRLGRLGGEDPEVQTGAHARDTSALRAAAARRGVGLLLMPPGMRRAKDNASFVSAGEPADIAKRRKERRKEKKREKRDRRKALEAGQAKEADGEDADRPEERRAAGDLAAEVDMPKEGDGLRHEEPTTEDGPGSEQQPGAEDEGGGAVNAEPATEGAAEEDVNGNASDVERGPDEPPGQPAKRQDQRIIHWTVELVHLSPPCSVPAPSLHPPVSEHSPLSSLAPPPPQGTERAIYLACPTNPPGRTRLWPAEGTLATALAGRTVCEFPTLWIVDRPAGTDEAGALAAVQGTAAEVLPPGADPVAVPVQQGTKRRWEGEQGPPGGFRGRGRGRGGGDRGRGRGNGFRGRGSGRGRGMGERGGFRGGRESWRGDMNVAREAAG